MYIELYIKRRESKKTMKEVAKELGMRPEWYSKKEKGKQDFTLREARKLAKMFDCTLDELFGSDFNESA